MRNKILALLNIRSSEAWLVSNLFWLQFFQGVGVAIFNTVAFTFFLTKFEITELPKVYLFSAVLLWITGWVYSKVEHAVEIKKLVPGIIIFVAFSILAVRLNFFATEGAWFFFLIFSWYYVIYLLTNLEFWGLAALLFDIRQSKRLFGMIGAGDIPAKIIGYSAVPVFIVVLGKENMLYVSFASFLISLVFYYRLKQAGKLDIHLKHDHAHDTHSHQAPTISEVLLGFFGNRMIAMVAALSFIVVTCVTVITFSFYSEIKHEAHSDVQLASFIAMFFAGGRVLAIFIRLIFTGRITNILGTKGTLLISPAILSLFLIIIVFLPVFSLQTRAVVYIFGLMAIITEVLKTSLQDPAFLSLMQPLSSSLRLKGHTVVKGVMDPFALAFSGLMLYSLVQVSHHVSLYLLSYVLIALIVIWVGLIFLVDREYVYTLVTALDKRYSIGQEINLTDERTREVLLKKVVEGERGEAIYILNLAERNYSETQEELVLKAFEHKAPEVRMEAIRLAERKKITAVLPLIDNIIDDKVDHQLLPEAVKAKCMLQPDELETFDEILQDRDPRLTKSAITGFMASGGISAVVTAGQKLLQLIASADATERQMAAEIIGELRVQSFYKPLLDLLKDADTNVVKAAISAAGKVRNEKLIEPLLQFFVTSKHTSLVVDALQEAGDVALPYVERLLFTDKLTRKQQVKMIQLCGRIGSQNAALLLDRIVWERPQLRSDAFHALHLCKYQLEKHNKQRHVELANHYIAAGIRTLFMIQALEQNQTARVLVDALYIEMDEIRDSLLLLFSFVYNKDKMMRAKSAFQQKNKESIANALEILEIEVQKDMSLKFIKAFEPGEIHEKCAALSGYFKETLAYENIVSDILNDTHHHYHRWTKAAALHSVIFYKGTHKGNWLTKAAADGDILLSETAQAILKEMN